MTFKCLVPRALISFHSNSHSIRNRFIIFVCKNQSFDLRISILVWIFYWTDFIFCDHWIGWTICTPYFEYQMNEYLSRKYKIVLAFMLSGPWTIHSQFMKFSFVVLPRYGQVMGIGMGMIMRIWGLKSKVWIFNCWTAMLLLHRHKPNKMGVGMNDGEWIYLILRDNI